MLAVSHHDLRFRYADDDMLRCNAPSRRRRGRRGREEKDKNDGGKEKDDNEVRIGSKSFGLFLKDIWIIHK